MSVVDRARSIFDACEAINGSCSGSGDPLPPEDEEEILAFLRSRLDAWEVSSAPRGAYDEAARRLILATLELPARWRAHRSDEVTP